MRADPQLVPVFLRAHIRDKQAKPGQVRDRTDPAKWANFALVFDCETTTDIYQSLTFLFWRFCELKDGSYVCQKEGVAYADNLDHSAVARIRNYASKVRAEVEAGCCQDLLVQTRTEFVDGMFWEAIQAGASIVCFNAPFDLSRLALHYREARKKNTGWSMVLWMHNGEADKFKPRLRIEPKDSRSAFVNLAGGDKDNRTVYRGRFLDLSVLGTAMRSKHMTLDGFLESFGLPGKIQHAPTGRITKKELEYGRYDVDRTLALLNAMKAEYDRFPLDLPPEKAMSAASITKAFLNTMNVTPPGLKFKLSSEILGKCFQPFYGGRSEIRARHQELPVVVCDMTSEYPTIAIRLNLWSMLTAEDIAVVDCTEEAQAILDGLTLEHALGMPSWQSLSFFALIRPAGDILPVRSTYGQSGNTNIGLNPLTSHEPIWYSGLDLVGSKLKTGRAPQVIQAFKLILKGKQKGLKATVVGTRKIDPARDDFFRVLIEERKKLDKEHPHHLLLKIIANALYGIFAELNTEEFGKNAAKLIEVFSGEHKFSQRTTIIERPGKWHFPPAAAPITAGGRLMLTILECLVDRCGGTYLLTDTDSMFIVASEKGGLIPCPGGTHLTPEGTPAVLALSMQQVRKICMTMNQLNPYDKSVIPQILKIEDLNQNRAGKPRQIYGVAVSAKRYCLYRKVKHRLQIIKPSEHGLGFLYVPDNRKRYIPEDCKDQSSYPYWIVEAWERLLADHFRMLKNPESALASRPLWFDDIPAVMRARISTPRVMSALRKLDPSAAKPFNFAILPILADHTPDCTLVSKFSKKPEEWAKQEYIEIHTGKLVKLHDKWKRKALTPQTVRGVLWRHFLHPEDKSLAPEGQPCNAHTRGLLLRRPVQAMTPFIFMGKEIERKAQEGEDISVIETTGPMRYEANRTRNTHAADSGLIARAKRFPIGQIRTTSGSSQHSVERFLGGVRVSAKTRECMLKAVLKLERATLKKRS